MRPRATSAFVQAMILIALTALVVQTANIIALATTPTPSTVQFSLRQAANVLRNPEVAAVNNIPVVTQSQAPSGQRDPALEALLALLLDRREDQVRVLFASGASVQVFAPEPPGSDESETKTPQPLPDIANLPPETRTTVENAPLPEMIAAMQRADGDWIVIGDQGSFWSDWRVRLALTFLASLVVLLPLAWWAARRTSRPLRDLARHVLVQDKNALAAAPLEGSREMQAVANAIVQLRERLDAQLADRERIVAAMAHDLRTPLTGLRLRAEQAPEPARQRMIDDIKRMEAMIADVIDYSHSRQPRPSESVDVVPLVQACVKEAALQGDVRVEASPTSAIVLGDAMKLRRAVGNLIGNAQKYGGAARVSLDLEEERIRICVDDDGPGIAEQEMARLFEPFQRGEGSRNRATGGAGLGLTVARDVAHDHGGAVRLENRPSGGLRATLDLPLASEDGPLNAEGHA